MFEIARAPVPAFRVDVAATQVGVPSAGGNGR
jgi:hypothetical protein